MCVCGKRKGKGGGDKLEGGRAGWERGGAGWKGGGGGEVEQMNTSDTLCMMWSYKNIRLLFYKCFIQVFRLV